MVSTMKSITKTLVMLFISVNLLGTILPCAGLPQQGLLPSDSPTTPTSLPLSWNASSSPLSENTTTVTTTHLSNKNKPPGIYCKSFCIHKALYPTFDYGPVNLNTSNPATLLTCLDNMWSHLNPATHKNNHPKGHPTDWRRKGFHCSYSHIFQLSHQTLRKGRATPSKVLQGCYASAQKAAKEGREWFNCQVKSWNGISTHAWFGWSLRGCKVMKGGHIPECSPEIFEEQVGGMDGWCWEEPCSRI